MTWECLLCPRCVALAALLATMTFGSPAERLSLLPSNDPDSVMSAMYKNPVEPVPMQRRLKRSAAAAPPPAEVIPLVYGLPSNPGSSAEINKEGFGFISGSSAMRKRHNSSPHSAFVPRHAIPEDRMEGDEDGLPDYARSCRYWRDFQRLIEDESKNSKGGCCCFGNCGKKRQAPALDAPSSADGSGSNGTSPESTNAPATPPITHQAAHTPSNNKIDSTQTEGQPAGANTSNGQDQPPPPPPPSAASASNSPLIPAGPVAYSTASTMKTTFATPTGPRMKRDRKGKHKKRRHASNRPRTQHNAVARAVQEFLQPKAIVAGSNNRRGEQHQFAAKINNNAAARKKRQALVKDVLKKLIARAYIGGEAEPISFGRSSNKHQKMAMRMNLENLVMLLNSKRMKVRFKRSKPKKQVIVKVRPVGNNLWPAHENIQRLLIPQQEIKQKRPEMNRKTKRTSEHISHSETGHQNDDAGPALGADMDPNDTGANMAPLPDQPPPVPLKIDNDQEDRTHCRFCKDVNIPDTTYLNTSGFTKTFNVKGNVRRNVFFKTHHYQVQQKCHHNNQQQVQPQLVVPFLPKRMSARPVMVSSVKYVHNSNNNKSNKQSNKQKKLEAKSQKHQSQPLPTCGIKWTPAKTASTSTVSPLLGIATDVDMSPQQILEAAAGKGFLGSMQGPLDYHPWIPYFLCPWSASTRAATNAEPVWLSKFKGWDEEADGSRSENLEQGPG